MTEETKKRFENFIQVWEAEAKRVLDNAPPTNLNQTNV